MFEAIGIGDLHLTDARGKGGLSNYVTEPDKMVSALAQQALDFAKHQGIKHVFLYGDICDGTRMSEEARIVLLKILKQDFEFHIILGNHDKFAEESDAGHSMEFFAELEFENVHIYTETTKVNIGLAVINFMPWPDQKFRSNCLNVAHVNVSGAKSDSGMMLKGDDLSVSKYVAVIGHIHTMQQVRNSFYSGTLYQTNFGEPVEKYFHHISYDEGDWAVSRIPVKPIYQLHTIEVLSKKDLRNVPNSEKDLLKLVLLDGCGVTALDYQHLNVVKVQTAKTIEELKAAAFEDLVDGSEVRISSEEFFTEWLRNSSVAKHLKIKAARLRRSLLA